MPPRYSGESTMTDRSADNSNSDPESERSTALPTWFLPAIFGGLLLFGVLVAAGAYLSDPTPDWRKPVIVLTATGCFLGGWALLLKMRRG